MGLFHAFLDRIMQPEPEGLLGRAGQAGHVDFGKRAFQ